MNTIAFANLYQGLKSDKEREDFILKHFRGLYVPLTEKVRICKEITSDTRGAIIKYVLYFTSLFSAYTDIEISKDVPIVDQYDTLKRYNLIDVVIGLIPDNEFKEFNFVLNMITEGESDGQGPDTESSSSSKAKEVP